MNHWTGIGNIGQDPVLRTTASGKSILNLNIAVDTFHYRKNEDGTSHRTKSVNWIPVVVWGVAAETNAAHLKKGSKVCIEGELRQRIWSDQEGKKSYTFEIHAKQIHWLDNFSNRHHEVVNNPADI